MFKPLWNHRRAVVLRTAGKSGNAASNKGMVDIHDRRPLVPVHEWLSEDTSPERTEEIAKEAALPVSDFSWPQVSKKVGSPKIRVKA